VTTEDLLAAEAIRDLQRRYCRGVDRLDWQMVRAVFHDDADLDYGFMRDGPDQFVATAREGLLTYSSTTHFIGNQLVEVDPGGQSARAEHYVTAWHRCPADDAGPERDFVCWFRYADRCELRRSEWRIAARVLLVDRWRTDPVGEAGLGPTTRRGIRGPDDPSFTI